MMGESIFLLGERGFHLLFDAATISAAFDEDPGARARGGRRPSRRARGRARRDRSASTTRIAAQDPHRDPPVGAAPRARPPLLRDPREPLAAPRGIGALAGRSPWVPRRLRRVPSLRAKTRSPPAAPGSTTAWGCGRARRRGCGRAGGPARSRARRGRAAVRRRGGSSSRSRRSGLPSTTRAIAGRRLPSRRRGSPPRDARAAGGSRCARGSRRARRRWAARRGPASV